MGDADDENVVHVSVNLKDFFLPALQAWPVYNGSNMPLVKFVRKLNEKATAAGYTEERLTRMLPLQLSGAAKIKYDAYDDKTKQDYRRVLNAHKRDFRTKNYIEIAESKLHHVKQDIDKIYYDNGFRNKCYANTPVHVNNHIMFIKPGGERELMSKSLEIDCAHAPTTHSAIFSVFCFIRRRSHELPSRNNVNTIELREILAPASTTRVNCDTAQKHDADDDENYDAEENDNTARTKIGPRVATTKFLTYVPIVIGLVHAVKAEKAIPLFVLAKCDDRKTLALVDTGSSLTFINKTTFPSLHKRREETQTAPGLAANGSEIPFTGSVK
ncbi:hypothetical protein ANCCEY_03671 [Ancylostoma ceylanicum]|uniref:Peptidase A2 domain-containing protein n=1 Tax=Ancylostoma ceylanicum TaxID=53326 RepID=A0A0D6M4A6_9BILA|nr:hypothetical protein ANCCEY_03671 [Ancylostoma ceylanicum]